MAAPPKQSAAADDEDALRLPRTLHERTYMSELGQRLRALREERGMTQHALARAAGIATDMVSRLENGHYTSPGLRTLVRLAEGMGVGVAAMLPELVSAATARDPDTAARARLQALLARASTSDVELIADLAAAVLAKR